MKTYKWYDEGDRFESDDFNESVSVEVDCYITTLHRLGIPIADMTEGDCYYYSVGEMRDICEEYGVKVEVVS